MPTKTRKTILPKSKRSKKSAKPLPRQHATYLDVVLGLNGNNAIEEMFEALVEKDMLSDTDAFAASGVSGIVFASKLAYLTKKELIVVRKDFNKDHFNGSKRHAEGVLNAKYIFVDDLICSGTTFMRVINAIKDRPSDKSECVGIALYGSRSDGYEGRIYDKTETKEKLKLYKDSSYLGN